MHVPQRFQVSAGDSLAGGLCEQGAPDVLRVNHVRRRLDALGQTLSHQQRLVSVDAAFALLDIIGVPVLDKSYVPPLAPQLQNPNIMNGEAMYNTQLQKLVDLIGQGIADFFQNYFPLGPYDQAVEWLRKAIVDGGTGMNSAVDQQLRERGKARLIEESMEAEASLTES